jgi:EAL domain-containing protein (putative c-di-GMP-specific phosphodiesterase class I)/FixJ family two-component response regulator
LVEGTNEIFTRPELGFGTMTDSARNTRLLILDDDPAIGATIARMAQSATVECRFTSVAKDFYAELETWQPTHIALDLVMPDHDGIEVLHQLAERHCDAVIIITSGVDARVLEAAHRSAKEHGLNIAGTIAKPFSLTTLRGLLSQARQMPEAIPASAAAPHRDFEVTSAMLMEAMDRNQLSVAFQPKVSCANGKLAGFEGLVRWQHPEHGMIFPDQFVPFAEQAGLSDRMTQIVFESALAWFSRKDRREISLALNVSAASLERIELADRLAMICDKHSVDPSSVIIEVTESSAMTDQTAALDLLTRLRLKGFQLSIDDFGVGHSSLVQLARLPFSELKIDKSFVMTAMHSAESRNIIGAIIGLARSLGLRTVAEGVEDLGVFGLLKDLGCDQAQGYFIGRPMHVEAVSYWMGEVADAG